MFRPAGGSETETRPKWHSLDSSVIASSMLPGGTAGQGRAGQGPCMALRQFVLSESTEMPRLVFLQNGPLHILDFLL